MELFRFLNREALGDRDGEASAERDQEVQLEAALGWCEWALYCQVEVDAKERVEEKGDDKEGLELEERRSEKNDQRDVQVVRLKAPKHRS